MKLHMRQLLTTTALLLTAIPTLAQQAQLNETDDSSSSSLDVHFRHFIAHGSNMTCSSDEHVRPFNNQIRGVNLGGWMVLEPWITPSLFYQFLGGDENSTAFDIYTFCEVLGPKEANRQLRRHWETWVTEDIIRQLSETDAVNSLRLPIGDFMYKPYGPYKGCVDGSLDYVENLLDWAYEYGLSVLLDIHALKDSQNGFDNSGQAMGMQWTSVLNTYPRGLVTFEHWPIRTASWVGEFDVKTVSYPKINYANIQHALDVIKTIVDMYGGHPAVLGLQPVNEPWEFTPIKVLKKFYWDGYMIVKSGAPYWKFVMHDSFRFDVDLWGGFMDGCPERALDTHIYQAWRDPDSRIGFYQDACRQKAAIADMERAFGPVVVGEWSLATDNCAMWLNGFNDNLPGFPRLPCKYVPCADPYMGPDQPGTPVDPTKPIQGPYGTGMSGPTFGFCPVGRDWLKESSGNPYLGRDWVRAPPEAPKRLDDTDDVMRNLAKKKINAFSGIGHGFYFWNFRTDLYEPHWSYMAAVERGWISRDNLNTDEIMHACDNEDTGAFNCKIHYDAPDENIKSALGYIFNFKNQTASDAQKLILNMTGDELRDEASDIINAFFQEYRHDGVTCDFGGLGYLLETKYENRTDDSFVLDDDEYVIKIVEGPNVFLVSIAVCVCTLVSLLLGFTVLMRLSKGFNSFVRHASVFHAVAHTRNSFIRTSLALPSEGPEYEEIMNEVKQVKKEENL